ncbi:serine/threonine protein kinase [Phytomonospora endophytica]|uniref:non-specific serine/threonine protein kinase n=1 Tax=Phytomonospora endophytica TaxID=714109 RepID=A0A841F9S7_9ACTN|nr:serine/threonine protein kinase [Phytomonospora endophytica]MBB6033006.1 serine/threonine-protein kinase [Phytomonospora endophytica]GIG65232.1 hypothetical protein Pen01_15270 [Phytomonospora endophytica]
MLRPGDVLGERYRLTGRVGGGGMGDVWAAVDLTLGRKVAVKVLLARYADEADFRERFRREARAIASLESPGIVDVYDYDECRLPGGDAVSYLIMQFIEGDPLSRRLGSWGRLHVADAMRLVAQAAEALHVAHEAGIIHRDIKPGNMLVRPDGRLVLVDFGIARDPSAATLTATGAVLGTATYMSPEQASGLRATAASDIYSLGVVAHQALSGEPPFTADTPFVVASMHVRQPPPPLPADIPEPVREFVATCLAKEPSHRWPNAGQMSRAARRLADRPNQTVPMPTAVIATGGDRRPQASRPVRPAAPEREPRPGAHRRDRRRRQWIAGIVVGVMVLLAAAATAVAGELWGQDTPTDTGGGIGRHLDEQQPIDAHVPPGGDTGPGPESSASADPSAPASEVPSASSVPSSSTPSPSPSSSDPSKPVPSVVGMTEDQARRTLGDEGFVPEVAYTGEGTPCTVSEQDPGSQDPMPPGTTVRITVQRTAEACVS